jgi:hypothetical protein
VHVEERDEVALAAGVGRETAAAAILHEEAQPHAFGAVGAHRQRRLPHLLERGARQHARRVAARLARAEQEAQVLREVAERRVEAAVADGDAGVEVGPFVLGGITLAGVAVRAERLQVVRGPVEVAARHAERTQHVLLHVDLVLVAAQRLDGAAEEDDAGVAVAPLRTRRELDRRVRQHRHQLAPLRRLVRMPVLVAAPRPGRRAEPRRMRHQVPQRDGRHRPERIAHGAQFGHEVDHRLLELQLAAVAQLHHREAGERLGAARPVEVGVAVDATAGPAVGMAVAGEELDVLALHGQQRRADDAGLRAFGVERGLDLGPRGLEVDGRRILGQRHAGDEQGGEGHRGILRRRPQPRGPRLPPPGFPERRQACDREQVA